MTTKPTDREEAEAKRAADSLRWRFAGNTKAPTTDQMIFTTAWALVNFSHTKGFERALLDALSLRWETGSMGEPLLRHQS